MNKTFLIVLMIIIFSSCNVNKMITYQELNNSSWALNSIYGISEEENASFSKAFIKFSSSDSVYSGSNGCNFFSGKMIISDNAVLFGERMETKRFCKGINESVFQEILNSANNIKIKNNVLFLYKGQEKLAEFIPKKEE